MLIFKDLKPYKDLKIAEGISGVYLWGFVINEKFRPYYVGKSTNIAWRLTEHMANIIGGNYSIYDKESLLSFDKSKIAVYAPYQLSDKLLFLNARNNGLKKHVNFLVDNFHFTYAEVADYRTNGRIAEINTIESIGKYILINKRGGTRSDKIDVGNLRDII